MERTLKLSGGRGETRKILQRPDPTTEVADGVDLTTEAPVGRMRRRADGGPAGRGAGWGAGRMLPRPVGVVLAVVLGLLGAGAGYAYTRSAPMAAAAGVIVLIVAYLAYALAVP